MNLYPDANAHPPDVSKAYTRCPLLSLSAEDLIASAMQYASFTGRDGLASRSGDQLYIGPDVFHGGTSGMVDAERGASRWVMTMILAPAERAASDSDLHARFGQVTPTTMTKESEIPIPFTVEQLRSYKRCFKNIGRHEEHVKMEDQIAAMARTTGDDHALKKAG